MVTGAGWRDGELIIYVGGIEIYMIVKGNTTVCKVTVNLVTYNSEEYFTELANGNANPTMYIVQ